MLLVYHSAVQMYTFISGFLKAVVPRTSAQTMDIFVLHSEGIPICCGLW